MSPLVRILCLLLAVLVGTGSFTIPVLSLHSSVHRSNNFVSVHHLSGSDNIENDSSPGTQSLLQRARELRQEAELLESTLGRNSTNSTRQNVAPVVFYKSMEDSVWTFTYRFANQPEPLKEQQKATNTEIDRIVYAGILTLQFRLDGYSDLVAHKPTSSTKLQVTKAWGWDVETSTEDEKEYLMFSVDTAVTESSIQRFYFQARQVREDDGTISLREGTVTMKQDVVDSQASRWALFSPRGILAQFRKVGEFASKPTPLEVS